MEFESDESLKEWAKDKPLSILQLDPADRAVLRIADERDAIQKKTFTKWVNKHLKKAGRHVNDLFEDLQDGQNLMSLLEVLSGEHLPRERGRLRFHMLQNVQTCLNFLRYRKIKLVNIRAEDIVDGNPKLTLGLIWTIILHFQISDIVVGQEPNVSARDVLLKWAKRSTNRYPGVRVSDFTSSWRDGLAFNAIIHRNRPDLVDWRNIRQRHVRERLETAFNVAERVGVTRLLDPEDVDTNEPDEKSLMTYISSLYDVFPEPPISHPLVDSETQQRTNEYRELASQLHLWIREKINQMHDRTFPNTLIEVKKMATESTRFRNEEIPTRQREKQRLNNAFRELMKHHESATDIDLEPELHIETIEKNWSRLLLAHQDKDQAIQDELKRLERLQRLAEKVHREMKQVDSRLEELEQRVDFEAGRLDRLHPLDAKNIVDQLEHDIRLVEENIQSLFNDVTILRDGRYAQSSELQKRVERLHQRWVSLRSLLHSRLVSPLSSISFPIEERTVTRQTRTVLETRLVDTNIHFRQLQECIEWVKNKLAHVGDGEYGSDLPGVQAELDQMQREHKIVEQFQPKVQQCASAKNNFHGEELQLYAQHLNMLQKLYSELLVLSNKRLSDLETLQDFLQSATNELMWLNEKEDTEISRDWADKDLNLSSIHHYYESLMSELEKREIQFSAVVDRGEALVLQRHPASKCIEAYMAALQNQWSWVLQLTLCLETHLKHAQFYQHFFSEVRQAESWITKRDEMLNSVYSQSEFSLDEGERLFKGMQELRDELNHYGDVIGQLAEKSHEVVPMKQRRQPVTKPIKVRSVCDFKQSNVKIDKGDSLVLHDNAGRAKWRVTTITGIDTTVPGVIVTIPPPDKDAIESVERLRRQFDRSVALWQKKQLRMRQNMIFATIKVVKTWDLAQFIAMGQEQRSAIRKALNEDAEKLISEGDPSDPQLRRLRREIDEVNRLFDEFERRARADEDSKNIGRIFETQVNSLLISLDEAEATLNQRVASPLPRDLDSLEHLVIQHKEFETRLQSYSSRVEEVQKTFRDIPRKTPQQQAKLEKVLTKWETLWHVSRLYVERLKLVEVLLTGMDEASNNISELEHKLAAFTHMPSDVKQLQKVHEELLVLQSTVSSQQHVMTQLAEDAHSTRRLVEESRKHKGPHEDLNRVDNDIARLNSRWSSVVNQLSDRLRSCDSAYGMLQKFSGAYEGEVTFVEDSYSKLNSSQEVDASKGMYTSVVERHQHIEQVNLIGNRYMREAKIYDDELESYVKWLVAEVHPSLDVASQYTESPAGAHHVAEQLDHLNLRFQSLVDALRERLRQHALLHPDDKHLEALLATEPKTMETYRTEYKLYQAITTYSSTESYSEMRTVTSNGSSSVTINGSSQGPISQVDSPRNQFTGSTMEFTEMKSHKRIERVEEGIGTDNIINCLGIVHPETGRTLTVGEAITLRILDVRGGTINTLIKGKTTPISIDTAVKYGIVDGKLAETLLGPCGVFEDGRELSLLEAIQRNILNAESGTTIESLMKVSHSTGGLSSTSSTTSQPNPVLDQKFYFSNFGNNNLTLSSAIERNVLDPETGMLTLENGATISLADGYQRGVLTTQTYEKLFGKERGLSLTDAIEHGIVDEKGLVLDRNTGEKSDIEVAARKGLVNANVREIVDSKEDDKITVREALCQQILDPKTGTYKHGASGEILPLCEAKRRKLIGKPMSLKEAVEQDVYLGDGRLKSPTHNLKLTMLEGVGRGVLDENCSKTITDTKTDDLVTLSQALAQKIVTIDGNFEDRLNSEKMEIPEAVGQGLITSVAVRTIFNIDAFQIEKDFVSLNVALEKGLVFLENGVVRFKPSLDSSPMTIDEGIKAGLIRKSVLDMLQTPIGVKDDRGRELNVLEATLIGYVDPKIGMIRNPNTSQLVPMNDAVRDCVITEEGAMMFNSMLNITLTTQTVTKTIQTCTVVKNTAKKLNQAVSVIVDPSDEEFLRKEVEVAERVLPERPKRREKTKSPENIIKTSPIEPSLDKIDTLPTPRTSPAKIKTVSNDLPDTCPTLSPKIDTTPIVPPPRVKSPKKPTENEAFLAAERTEVSLELPKEGWTLAEAIQGNEFDAETGLLVVPKTDRLVTLEECIQLNIIDPLSAQVVDPKNNRLVTLKRALEKGILSNTGQYFSAADAEPLPLQAAIAKGLVILDGQTVADKTESAEFLDPVQVSPSVIFDPTTALVIYTDSVGSSDNLISAVVGGKVKPEVVKVRDPESLSWITVSDAISKGIIDESRGVYKDSKGEMVSIADAVKSGALCVLGAALVAAVKAGQAVMQAFESEGKSDEDDEKSLGEITRERVTTEPKYKVAIGKARSMSQSPEHCPKPVVLQKMRRKILRPNEAVQEGIIDLDTVRLLEQKDPNCTLLEAIARQEIEGDKGTIKDPQRGDLLTINQAIARGILNGSGESIELVVPLARSLSIPEVIQQGLLTDEGKVIHPETGADLSLREAIICDIVDPQSTLVDENGVAVTLEQAIEKGYVNDKDSILKTKSGPISLANAVEKEIFSTEVSSSDLPKVAMTLPVALDRGLVDAKLENISHPVTKETISFADALEQNFIMAVPHSVAPCAMDLKKAVAENLINVENNTFRNPVSGEDVPVKEAIEAGLLLVKPDDSLIVVDTVKSFQTITTKIIDLAPGYILLGANEVQNTHTGEIISLAEARLLKIAIEEMESKATFEDLPKVKSEKIADDLEVIMQSPDTLISVNGVEYTVKEAQTRNLIDPETATLKKENGEKISISDAAKLGLFAVVAAPVLAGKAVASLFKSDTTPIPPARRSKDRSPSPRKPSVPKRTSPESEIVITARKSPPKEASVRKTPSFQKAVTQGLVNLDTGHYKVPNTGQEINIYEAASLGLIDPSTVFVKNPVNDEIMAFKEAVDLGILIVEKGVVVNLDTREEIGPVEAIKKGAIVLGYRKPISLEAVVAKGLYEPKTGKIVEVATKRKFDIDESVQRGIIDSFISECRDAKAKKWMTLDDALTAKLVNPKTGKMKETALGTTMTLDEAAHKGLVRTTPVKVPLIDSIVHNYYAPESGTFFNPTNADDQILRDAISCGFADDKTVKIKDRSKDVTVTVGAAVESGLLDDVKGVLTNPPMTLDVALEKGYLVTTKKPCSLQEALTQGCYDPKTGLMVLENGEKVTLDEAIQLGEINRNAITVKDPRSGDLITLEEAVKIGVIDGKLGVARDPTTGAELAFYDALDRGLIIPAKRKFSLPEAVFKGFYDPESGKFINPGTKEKLATDRAIRQGIIDPHTTLVKNPDGEVTTFENAVEKGLIDVRVGALPSSGMYGTKLNFKEAFEQGLLIEVRQPMSLTEALMKNVFDPVTGKFLDPSTGQLLTLAQAVEKNVIDSQSVDVKDTKTGFWKKLSLVEAIAAGLIDGDQAVVTDLSKNKQYSLAEAFDLGLLSDSKAAVSVQRAIHQGLYDDETGKMTDPNTGRNITLHEAIRRFIINPQLPCYWDKKAGRLLSLGETCRAGIIDRRAGVFKEPGSNNSVSLSKAMDLGLIVDIESAGFGLYEAIAMGLYDEKTRKFVHPTTGRQLKLSESIQEEFINPLASVVKNCASGKYVKLTEAILPLGIIDDHQGVYKTPDGEITLSDAQDKLLIIPAKRPLTVEEALRVGLFRSDSGRFVDPETGSHVDLAQGIASHLLSADTTAVKDPVTLQLRSVNAAIEDSTVDVGQGAVVDKKEEKVYKFDEALDMGLIVTIERPLTFQQAVHRGSIDPQRGTFVDPRTMRECTLEEAIRHELIDPESAVAKDPAKGVFKTLRQAIIDGTIDLNRKATFDPNTGKIKSLCILFDQGTLVFLREPISLDKAIDLGQMNILTGKFTDPESKETLTLKEAVQFGLVDPDSALVRDVKKSKLVKISEAFRKGLMDSDKANVVDTDSSKLYSLANALDTGLLLTPKFSLSLMDGLKYSLYNPTTGGFADPFLVQNIIDRKRLTLREAIDTGLIDPSSTVVKDTLTGGIQPLPEALSSGLVDGETGRVRDGLAEKDLDLIKAREKGLLLPAKARQAMEEKYRICDEALQKLLAWVGDVEDKVAHQDVVQEDSEQLRNQINTLKAVKDDIHGHNRPITACLDQVRQIVATGGEVLSSEEISSLEKNGQNLKKRFDKVQDRTEKLLKKLVFARDELSKFKTELSVFCSWLEKARKTCEEKERVLADLNKLSANAESTREFVSDVIVHQADLRFITMNAQKFVDESKEYLNCLNEFRTSLPQRLPHIEPVSAQDSMVRNEVALATTQYRDLLARANALSDRLSGVGGRQREYRDALEKARAWLKDAEPRALKLIGEPVGAELRALEEQLARAKALNSEFVANGRLIDAAKQACTSLLRSLDGQQSAAEMKAIEAPVRELEDKYVQLSEALAERLQALDTALVQSQGVQDALDSLITWLNSIETTLKNLNRPASLNKERLDEQLREQRLAHAEIESHRASLESVAYSAQDLVNNSSNARLASKIQAKLSDVLTRYEKVQMKSLQRGDFLAEVSRSLNAFNVQVEHFEQWHTEISEHLDSRDLDKLSHEDYAHRVDQLIAHREKQRPHFEEMIANGKNLIAKKDVTDVGIVRDKIKSLEGMWKDLNLTLEERQKSSRARAEQLTAYERLRDSVIEWLSRFETQLGRLEPVALDLNILKRQSEELKPLLKDYREYSTTLDKLNDLGSAYDALTRSESPVRRRSSAYSPTKRPSLVRRPSHEGRSPSPTKNYSPLSPAGSSGFSSRRSSQENFHLEELSPVQQQLSEINHRYSMLGVKLTDRQTELETVRDEVKKNLDNLRNLSQFLDKVQRQLPKDFVPMTREDSDKAAKSFKAILEEMYEKQSLLDSTRTAVKDLLKRKPAAAGADTLHDELEDVITRWKSLSDRCKSRIKLMEDMKDFHDTHDSLSNWLSAKDRMMAVLGPISSDSRMVQSQVQQVQVLREEFRSQQPQLQHLTDIGESILSQVDQNSPDGQRLASKLSAILQRWADLLGRLDERASSLGAAADTSREFDAGCARLRDALQAISDQLDDLPLDKDPEEQLRKIQNLERQLEGQRPLLADIEAAGAQLSEVLTDPASRAEIQSKLAALARQYNNLQKKLDHRKAEIEGSLRDGRQLEQSCARTVGWLTEELSGMSERLLVSADKHVLQQQLEQHEPIYKEVMNKEHEVIMLLNKAKDALSKSAQRSDTRNLQRDVEKIQQLWDKLRKEAVDRQTRLLTCMEHCKKYYRGLDAFLPWLSSAEVKLDALRPVSFKKKDIEKQLKEISAFRNEVWKHSGEYENTRMLGETFQGACDIDKEVVRNELTDLKKRWDKLNNDVMERTQNLEETARRLADFTENLRELDHSLQRCEDKLSNHDVSDPKLLEKVKALKEEVAGLKKPLLGVRQQAGDLALVAGEMGVDAGHLQDEVDVLGERMDHLSSRLDDRVSELQSAASAVHQFNEQAKQLTLDLSNLERELDAMKPPAREVKIVRAQLDDIARFVKRITKASDDVAALVRASDNLVDPGLHAREQIESLRRTLARLDERSRAREEDLDSTLQKLEQFYELHTVVLGDIHKAQEQVHRLKPVGSEVEGIKSQQEESRALRRNVVEPLSQQVADCNRKGQGLVQSAAGGVSTTVLEKDLERMMEKWNQLKEKMNERDRRLDVGLLQSGKFQEALDGLAKWLSDTEEMVANQKPPSADYKVVKAQLQEQKFLKKMLLDRQHSMSSLFTMGQEVAAGAEPSERKAIERQLKELMGRFDNLTEGAQRRMLDLEQAMRVAKEFQDKLVPIVEWLDKTEKKVKEMELVPTDEEKIQQRIKEHDALHNEIIRKKAALNEVTEVADKLMGLVGEDEASTVADRVAETVDRYSALCDASDAVGELLQASRAGLRHLVLTYQDLQAWMEAMEKRLNAHRALGVHTEKLLQQMDDLADLTEEIANRHSQVDSTVDSGLELMKHISSDEAIQLKDKLDSLQRRYNDLTARGSELLKNAQEALPLVQQFHNSHHRLVDWMLGAEAQLQHEPREEEIMRLEQDLVEFRPVLENINLVGPQLCQLSPGEGAATIEGLVTRDNRRFDAIAEQIQRKAERLNLSKQRSLEVTTDMEELLEWFREVETALRDADPPSSDPDAIRGQLKEHRALQDDITSQKSRGRDVIATAKKVLRESTTHDDTSPIREKLEDLREMMDVVSALSSDRLSVLEQALPLAEHFVETHNGLASWLDDIEAQVNMLALPALRPDKIVQQQDRNEMFIQWISDQKPLVDKLNKTGEALIRLVNEDDGAKVQDVLDADNARYQALKAQLRQRQQALEQALQDSSRFSDKLEGMLRALQNTAEQIKGAEPVSAHPPKIRDQLEENNAVIEDLETRGEAFEAVKRAADDVINKAGNRADPAVKDIKKKLDKLNNLWNEVQKATSDRGKTLEDALAVAEKFWSELQSVMTALRDLSHSLNNQEPPAAQPKAIRVQQNLLQEIKQEIDQTKPEVEQVRQTGRKLMNICGEPDKPEVKKHIEDLDNAWDNITALYARREENLIDAMEKAMEFHETLQNLLEFLTRAENKFENMGALGSDIDAVKKQINQLRAFKDEVDPQMVKVEALNRQAHELTERTSADQALAIKEPLSQVNRRWDELLRGMVERQRQLEQALLRLGQFQHALTELLKWITTTNHTLDDLKPTPGDPQALEVELAKLKVLVNDIQAHQSSVDALNDAGRQLIEAGRGSQEASATQEQLTTLNRQWRDLLQTAADRQRELEDALREAQRFNAEIQDLLSWLSDVDSAVAASKPVGGLPETASEQLQRFMEVYEELELNRPKVESVLQQGNEYLKRSSSATNLAQNLKTLKQRWDSVTARANDKKIKLEIALKEATEFHEALQAFVDWLTGAEKTLLNMKPVSRVMETILTQIEEHKAFQKEVSTHRETMLNLDKKGTHLKYFSQKQDVILIKNLLISVQHRWERVVSKSAERTRALDHGYKEAREFHDAWSSLMTWLTDTEKELDTLAGETGNDPEKIKQRLAKHREFQRALSGKQATYDATMKAGKSLKDKAPKTDEAPLRDMLNELKNKWTSVCAKSVDRQRKLEEALLFSGQFKDAVQALMEWLQKADKMLSDEGPVHGDLDTVNMLFEQHRHFEQDLKSRSVQLDQVKKTGKDLAENASVADASVIRQQLSDLTALWDRVNRLKDRKTKRLEEALKEAQQLHKSVDMLLEWLSDAEMKLRFAGVLPEDEQETRNQMAEHEKFLRELAEKEIEKDATIALAQRILAKAHPDGATVIKHWITIIQSRWEEVSSWAKQRRQRLDDHIRSLRDADELLEELLAWLAGLEKTLISLESEPLPDDISTIEALIDDHKEFMENTHQRQGEVDSVCKSRQVQVAAKDRKLSRPKTPGDREGSPDFDTLSRKSSLAKSRENLGDGARRGSRVSPSRDGRSDLPHYGPRFPPKGSKGAEPAFRSPRVKLLWDRWRNVWLLAWERQRRLHEKLAYLREVEKMKNFSWDEWRRRFLKFMNHKKSRLTDLFRKMDKNNDGLIPRDDFIDGIVKTKFDTSKLEMDKVADKFDNNGYIDWKEFIAALRPDWEERQPATEADKIHDEVKRLVMLCTCRQKFRVFQVGEGKYRFGDSQKLRLVRILRSTVMVRVGGGWVALEEFLQKNDPCRVEILPVPDPNRPEDHEPWCIYGLIERAEEFMNHLMPIIESVRAQQTTPVAFPLKVNTARTHGPTHVCNAPQHHWVRERSIKSVPMGSSKSTGRSSFSAGTPDSLSDTEGSFAAKTAPRKPSYRSSLTPGGSQPGSRSNSRPASRTGSKPPSRHGSNMSLDSTDDATPSRIPRSSTLPRNSLGTRSRLGVPNGSAGSSRPRTPTGAVSPSPGSSTRSRIPVYTGHSMDDSQSSSSCLSSGRLRRKESQIPMPLFPSGRARTPSASGSTTPVPPGMTPLGSKLQRKPSGASDISGSASSSRRGSTKTPTDPRAPFRL